MSDEQYMLTTRGHLVVESDGAARWEAYDLPAVASSEMIMPDGSRMTACVSDPARVLSWSIPAGAAGRTDLEVIFGREEWWRIAQTRLKVCPSSGAFQVDRLLAPGWARLLLIAGTRRWLPTQLNPSLLTIDEGLAWLDAERPTEATRCLLEQDHLIVDLGHSLLSGGLATAAAAIVRRAVRAGVQLLTDVSDMFGELAEIQVQLDAADVLDHIDLTDIVLGELEALERDWTSKRELVRTESAEQESAGPGGFYDPACLPDLNTLVWTPPDQGGLGVEFDREAGVLWVTAALADEVDPRSREATSLIAVAATRNGGRPWSSAPLESSGGSKLSALLELHGADPDTLVVGVYDARQFATPRLDQRGRSLSLADRLLIEAWRLVRLAESRRVTLGADAHAEGGLRNLTDQAVYYVERSESVLDGVARSDIDDSERSHTRGRLKSASAYRQRLIDGTLTGPGSEPLLAELHIEADDE